MSKPLTNEQLEAWRTLLPHLGGDAAIMARKLLNEVYRLKAEQTDHPDFDCTDAAHPAWWRGHEHTTNILCQIINNILDGKDDGKGTASEPWESVRRRLVTLRTEIDIQETPFDFELVELVQKLTNSGHDPETIAVAVRLVLRKVRKADRFRNQPK